MYSVIERKRGGRKVIATEFRTKAAAQQHIADIDPAARRILVIEEEKAK